MRTKGKLITWNDDKGFGFIQPSLGGERVFIHIKAFKNRHRRPEMGQIIIFSLSSDEQGRPCAENALLSGDSMPKDSKQNKTTLSIIIVTLFFLVVGIAILSNRVSAWIFAFYIVISGFTYIMYEQDKSAAQKGDWRTKENTLHVLALTGGWPGALIAQQKLRHKSKKLSFRIVFWITVFSNCGIFVWLSSSNAAVLQRIIDKLLEF